MRQLCTGLADTLLAEKLFLQPPKQYKYCAMGNCLSAGDGTDDASDFRLLSEALASCDVSAEEQEAIWQLLASLLALGQVDAVPLSVAEDGATEGDTSKDKVAATAASDDKEDAAGPCAAFKADLTHQSFGMCKCGFSKAAHVDRSGSTMNLGAATGVSPFKP
jgi:hypothetical protein